MITGAVATNILSQPIHLPFVSIGKARLWLSQSPLWILDEPLTAIDKQGVSTLLALFVEHAAKGGMVLLTTHQELDGVGQQVRKIRLTNTQEN